MKLLYENLGVHRECGGSIPGSMKCDSWASLLARTFVSPCFRPELKAKVATPIL
jgi:hypothetical protein